MQKPSSKRRPPTLNLASLDVFFYMALILLALVLAWEGFKLVGRELEWTITRDSNMPHLSQIFRTLGEPNQRDSDETLLQDLLGRALITGLRALSGFVLGTAFGLFLAVVFVHVDFLRQGLMPYVVASQTVPILAIAPMVVIWTASIDARPLGVPLIAAYLAFFPVTIYALRGLADVPQTALELMQSYAAQPAEILFKLRFPNAIPYIFTALKITAPASVVGAVIGEMPSGIQDGLGGAIINYAQYYTSNPPRLWATNVVTAGVGIAFFCAIALLEWAIVRWKPPQEMV